MHDEQAAELVDEAHHRPHVLRGDAGKIVGTGVAEEGLEAQDTSVMQRRKVGEVRRDRPAPEADVDVALALGRLALGFKRIERHRGRDAVEWHVHERGDAPGRGGAGCRQEAFPFGVAGLADMDVQVDKARHQDAVLIENDGFARAGGNVEIGNRDDLAVGDADRGRALAVGHDGTRGLDE